MENFNLDPLYDYLSECFNKIDEQFSKVDQRFIKIEHRLDGIDTRLDKIEARLDGIEKRLMHVETTQDEHTKILSDIGLQLKKCNMRHDRTEKWAIQAAKKIDVKFDVTV